jgi:endoglucanase
MADVQSLLYAPASFGGAVEQFNLSVVSLQTTQLGTPATGSVLISNIALTNEVPYPAPTATFTPRNFKGVNISGGENGGNPSYPAQSGGCVPNCSYNYAYPQNTELDYWASKGMGLIRMPIEERRIQPYSYGSLDPVGRTDEPRVANWAAVCALYPSSPCQPNLLSIRAVLDHALADGLWVVLDPHDYGYFYDTNAGVSRLVGADPEGTAQFVDWWLRVSTVFENYPNVIFGLMNEPHAQTAAQWYTGATAVINGIAQVTKLHWVFIPGTAWTGVYSWVTSGNAASWAGYVPPAGLKIAFEGHEYLDSDNSGTHVVCAGYGSAPFTAMMGWAQAQNAKVWIGEIGWSQDPSCPPDATNVFAYLSASEPTLMGWSYWVGGNKAFYAPWNTPGGYSYSAVPAGSPGAYIDAPQTSILVNSLP